MAAINPLARELVLKIVFYGPGLGGKTTTLQHVHDMAKPEQRGKMVSLATAVDRTLYFDFLPLRLPKTRGMNVRLQLFTVPGQVYYNSTRKLVLTGADGIVFVADSQSARADANLESLENLQENLRDQKRELRAVPLVIQYNKRDLPDVLPVAELERTLNPHSVPSVETIATKGVGVFESLSLITKAALAAINDTLPAPGGSAEYRLANAEGGLSEALRASESSRGGEPQRASRKVSIVTENLIDSATPGSLSGFADSESDLFHLGQVIQPSPMPSIVAEVSKAPAQAVEPVPHATSTLPAASVAMLAPVSSPRTASPAPNRTTDKPVGWATPPIRSESPGFSFAALWGDAERELVRELEGSIATRSFARSVDLLDAIATRVLASAGVLLGSTEAPRDAALVPTLLGISGPRYVWFRALVRDARGGTEPDERAVLSAYAFVIELRLARGRVGP